MSEVKGPGRPGVTAKIGGWIVSLADHLPVAAFFAAVVAYIGLLVVFVFVAKRSLAPDFSTTGPVMVTAVLGAILNPPSDNAITNTLRVWWGLAWYVLVILTLAASVWAALFSIVDVVNASSQTAPPATHQGAPGAFVGCMTGLTALLVNTTRVLNFLKGKE